MKKFTTLFFFISLTLTIQKAESTTDTWFDSDNGTVTDVATGLVWQQQPHIVGLDYSMAITYCQTLNLASKSDWRLPQIKELTSMIDHRKSSSAHDSAFGVGTQINFWSATPQSNDSTRAWQVDFALGQVILPINKASVAAVRCVRNDP